VSLALFALLLLAPPAPAPVMFTFEETGRVGEAMNRGGLLGGKEMVLGRR
jgi:hypothetical protein